MNRSVVSASFVKLVIACSVLAAPLTGQQEWMKADGITLGTAYVATWDSARSRVVALTSRTASSDPLVTLEWNGVRWVERRPTTVPPGRGLPGLAFDSARSETIAFTITGQTWAWNGADWARRTPLTQPSPRSGVAIAEDPVRQRIVMFGGGDISLFGDTWEWDGSNWLRIQPATSPAPRQGAKMTWDPVRQQLLMFGGRSLNGALSDTWAWDGTTWTQLFPVSSPQGALIARELATDSSRGIVVLYDRSPRPGHTWTWDGSNWNRVVTSAAPQLYTSPIAFAYDGNTGGVIAASGDNSDLHYSETMAFDGTDWSVVDARPGWGGRLVADPIRNRVLMFGSVGATAASHWEWDGQRWEARAANPAPALGLRLPALSFDRSRNCTVLFGGVRGDSSVDETWEWDGASWLRMRPTTQPPALAGAVMAYDPIRAEHVMFGGFIDQSASGGGILRTYDTWVWDGANWTQKSPATIPTGLPAGSMLWDAARQRIVMIGMWRTSQPPWIFEHQTWEWDGVDWTRVMVANTPPGDGKSCAYDPVRGVIISWEFTGETWSFDGVDWTPEPAPVTAGVARFGMSDLVWDPANDRVIGFEVYGGSTWIYGPPVVASATRFGSGCRSSGGTPVLTSSGLPQVAGRELVLELIAARPNASAVILVAPGPNGVGARLGSCNLYPLNGAVVAIGPTNASGFAELALPIPVGSALFGTTWDCQGVVLDPTGGGLGLVSATRGLRLVVGY